MWCSDLIEFLADALWALFNSMTGEAQDLRDRGISKSAIATGQHLDILKVSEFLCPSMEGKEIGFVLYKTLFLASFEGHSSHPSVFMIMLYYFATKLKHDGCGQEYAVLATFFVCQCPIHL